MTLWNFNLSFSHLRCWCGPIHLANMHAPTFNKWHKKKKKKKVALHILIHGAMRDCMMTSLVVCINDNIRNIRERHVTIRREVCFMSICSLGFWNIREGMILWRLI